MKYITSKNLKKNCKLKPLPLTPSLAGGGKIFLNNYLIITHEFYKKRNRSKNNMNNRFMNL
jgi:hypothetical protein